MRSGQGPFRAAGIHSRTRLLASASRPQPPVETKLPPPLGDQTAFTEIAVALAIHRPRQVEAVGGPRDVASLFSVGTASPAWPILQEGMPASLGDPRAAFTPRRPGAARAFHQFFPVRAESAAGAMKWAMAVSVSPGARRAFNGGVGLFLGARMQRLAASSALSSGEAVINPK